MDGINASLLCCTLVPSLILGFSNLLHTDIMTISADMLMTVMGIRKWNLTELRCQFYSRVWSAGRVVHLSAPRIVNKSRSGV